LSIFVTSIQTEDQYNPDHSGPIDVLIFPWAGYSKNLLNLIKYKDNTFALEIIHLK